MPELLEHPSPSAVVVGAGVAGLTVADFLTQRGVRVVVLEREDKAGGLARSLVFGDFVFDIGPKRFHTYSPVVEAYLHQVLGRAFRVIGRKSSVYFMGKLHPWPLQTSSLFRLPPRLLLRCAADLFRKPPFDGKSFSSYILSRYGRTLYEVFFRDYTRKFCHEDPTNLHEAWAQGSIHRAIIDRRYHQGSLLDVARVALLPKGKTTRFLYPLGGMDRFHEAMVRRVVHRGGEVRFRTTARLTVDSQGRPLVVTGEAVHRADRVFWTGPITQAYADLVGKPTGLRHLGLALFAVEARRVLDGGNQWTYFSSPHLLVSRTSYPRSFDPSLVPPDAGSVMAEVTVPEGASIPWDEWESRVVRDLEETGVCRGSDIRAIHRVFIPHAYPVYDLNYQERLAAVRAELARFQGLVLAGRCGKFWYNNMDDSIEDGMAVVAAEWERWHTG